MPRMRSRAARAGSVSSAMIISTRGFMISRTVMSAKSRMSLIMRFVFEKLDILGHHVLDLVLGNAFAFRGAEKSRKAGFEFAVSSVLLMGGTFTIFSGITGCRRASASRARPWRRRGRRR